MTISQGITLLSAFLGASGTLLLFFGTYGFQPREGAVFGGPAVDAANAKIAAANTRRKLKQRIGLGLLCLSFIAQAAAVFFASN